MAHAVDVVLSTIPLLKIDELIKINEMVKSILASSTKKGKHTGKPNAWIAWTSYSRVKYSKYYLEKEVKKNTSWLTLASQLKNLHKEEYNEWVKEYKFATEAELIEMVSDKNNIFYMDPRNGKVYADKEGLEETEYYYDVISEMMTTEEDLDEELIERLRNMKH